MRLKWKEMSREDRIKTIEDGVKKRLSASQIAARLGCTRNSIIGFANRNKVKLGGKRRRDWAKMSATEKAKLLIKSFAAGLTVDEIVDLVEGATAKAIARCAERNGISRRVAKHRTRPAPKQEPRMVVIPEPPPIAPEPFPESLVTPRQTGTVNIMELEFHQCRYPMWDDTKPIASPDGWNFCGKPTMPGSSYCKECHGKVWVRPRKPSGYKRRYTAVGIK